MGNSWSRLMRWWGGGLKQNPEADNAPSRTEKAPTGEKEPPSVPCTMELRVMVETESPSPDTPSVLIDGKHWTLSAPLDIDAEPSTLPPYVCVSYVWGQGRAPQNPIHASVAMSDRTLATFAAAARCLPGRPIWIDAFCVPTERAKKRATLESLGFLFAQANAVVAVLAPETLAAVEEMEAFLALDPRPAVVPTAPIEVLEADEWIRSVWTYQEIVNGGVLWFVSRDQGDEGHHKAYPGSELLNIVGGYLDRWGKSAHDGIPGMRLSYPHADNFQDLIADWMMSDYGHRSALRIICGMDERAHVTPQNRFYSMIGALTSRPSARATNPTIEQLSERFMELCEEKGDYSFIFSTAPRDSRPGLRWRPIPSELQGILTWHTFGDEQPGTKVDGGILLEDVLVFPLRSRGQPSDVRMNQESQDSIRRWVQEVARYHPLTEGDADAPLEEQCLRTLRRMKFAGVGVWHVTKGGIFFPYTKLPDGDEAVVCASHGVRWVFGSPAIASVSSKGATQYVPGVFVGHMDHTTPTTKFLLT
ncbi:hypothetical protein C8Q77DRAFT_1198964 [Trametes polyzona]|nr:hypothetical protein C8Q77DRAFT_1198964 [Trametes polyzona]